MTDTVAEQEEEVITERLSRIVTQENVMVLKYGPDLLAEMAGLAQTNHLFDAIIIDCAQCGYLFPTELLIEASRYGQDLLEIQGTLLFLKSDKAIAFSRDSHSRALSFNVFNNHSELFDYSAPLAKHVQAVLGRTGSIFDDSTDITQQVLMSAIPVLTPLGVKMKAGMDSAKRRNAVIAAVDNYTPISTINHRIGKQGRLTTEELLEELRALEQGKAIYPVFAKISFLVDCFRNQTHFTLKEYLLAARLLSVEQLDEILYELQSAPASDRLSLGPLAVKKGYFNTRQLEIALKDQAFYGQSSDSQSADLKLVKNAVEDTQVQSLVGHLGSTDPSNLLQNIATNRESGVLSVEYKDLQFRAQFETGRITHAKVGRVLGNNSVIEFASAWKEGIFVFIQRTPPADLALESCKVSKPLDKLLLDAALAKDNMEVVFKKLEKGTDSVLERQDDVDDVMTSDRLVDPQEGHKLSQTEIDNMIRVWNVLDGLTPLGSVLKFMGDLTTSEFARAVFLLMHYELASEAIVDIATPMLHFQRLVQAIHEKLGRGRNDAFLRLGMRDGIGYSGRARIYVIGSNGEIGVDMAATRQTGASLADVIQDLENWQVKYIEYVSQELDRETLLSLIREIHQG